MKRRKKDPVPRVTETQITKSIQAYLETRGIWHFKVHGGLGQKKGLPDILGALPPDGRILGIEVKRPQRVNEPRGGCTIEQWDNLDHIAEMGGLALVAYSLEGVADIIEPIVCANSDMRIDVQTSWWSGEPVPCLGIRKQAKVGNGRDNSPSTRKESGE